MDFRGRTERKYKIIYKIKYFNFYIYILYFPVVSDGISTRYPPDTRDSAEMEWAYCANLDGIAGFFPFQTGREFLKYFKNF